MKRIVVTVSLLLLFAVSVQAQTEPPKPAPELKKNAEVFVGDWTLEGEAKETPLGPAGKVSGKLTIRWVLNGFFQEWKWVEKHVFGDIETIELNWYDAAAKSYPYQGFQDNGDLYSGSATVSGNVWNFSGVQNHNGIEYKTRGVITIVSDGVSFTLKVEISTDGKTWTPWAESKFTKVKAATEK